MADDTKDALKRAADVTGSYRRRIRDTEIRERKAGSEQTSQAPSEMKGSATGQEMTSIVSDIPSQPPPKKTDTPRQDQTDPAKPLKASSPSTHTQNSSSSTPETIQKQVPANQRPTAKASATTAKKSETSSQKVTKRAPVTRRVAKKDLIFFAGARSPTREDCPQAIKHYSSWMRKAGESHPQFETIKKRVQFCRKSL